MVPCSLEKKQRHPINYPKYLGGSSVFSIFSTHEKKKKMEFKLLAKTRLDVANRGVMSQTYQTGREKHRSQCSSTVCCSTVKSGARRRT